MRRGLVLRFTANILRFADALAAAAAVEFAVFLSVAPERRRAYLPKRRPHFPQVGHTFYTCRKCGLHLGVRIWASFWE